MATWWFGLLMGIVLGLVALRLKDATTMFKVCVKAIFIIMGITFAIGLLGLLYGKLFLASRPPNSFAGWFIPDGLEDFGSFISVGSMHNFSYAGGGIGLIVGIIYITRIRKKQAAEQNKNSIV